MRRGRNWGQWLQMVVVLLEGLGDCSAGVVVNVYLEGCWVLFLIYLKFVGLDVIGFGNPQVADLLFFVQGQPVDCVSLLGC